MGRAVGVGGKWNRKKNGKPRIKKDFVTQFSSRHKMKKKKLNININEEEIN